jgi:hypothetical protein
MAVETDATTTFAAAAVVLLVGYLIRYRRWESLVAGGSLYDRVPPVTVSLVGNVALVAGGFVAVVGALQVAGVADRVPELAWLAAFLATLTVAVPRLPLDATGRE